MLTKQLLQKRNLRKYNVSKRIEAYIEERREILMNKRVVTIEPAKMISHKAKLPSMKKRRVAGYARVSTDHEEQASSYESQMKYYTQYISSRHDWDFVKMYSDEGISGTNAKKRLGFQEMIE